MNKILLTLIFGLSICIHSSLKAQNDTIKYFDENNLEISKLQFEQIRSTNLFLEIPGDSIHHKKLTLREKYGEISNFPTFKSIIEKQINQDLDSNKPLIIIYHPGNDICNTSGSATKQSLIKWYKELDDGINKIVETKPIYMYKINEGLEKYDGILTWHEDPEHIVERLFFQYHYPCKSFVVISKEGNYISYFGEFSKEYVWETIRLMTK